MWVSVTWVICRFLRRGRVDVVLHVAVGIDDDGFAGGGAADQIAVLGEQRFEESLDDHSDDDTRCVHGVHQRAHCAPRALSARSHSNTSL